MAQMGKIEVKTVQRVSGLVRLVRFVALAGIVHALGACSDGGTPVADKGAGPIAARAAVHRADPHAKLIVAFGDSLYAGYGLTQRDGFVPELEKALTARGLSSRVYNAGVSGDTTSAGRQRLAYVLDGLPKTPDLVLVGLGGNDMLRGIPPEQTRANLDAILTELDRRGIPAVLTGMLAAPNLGDDYAKQFNAIFPELARKHHARLYPFFLDGVFDQPALMQADHIHPNARGVDVIVVKVSPIVAAAMAHEEQ